jgi:hypothetical protein
MLAWRQSRSLPRAKPKGLSGEAARQYRLIVGSGYTMLVERQRAGSNACPSSIYCCTTGS